MFCFKRQAQYKLEFFLFKTFSTFIISSTSTSVLHVDSSPKHHFLKQKLRTKSLCFIRMCFGSPNNIPSNAIYAQHDPSVIGSYRSSNGMDQLKLVAPLQSTSSAGMNCCNPFRSLKTVGFLSSLSSVEF